VHQCPAEIPADITAAAMQAAVDAHVGLGCRGATRSDFRYDPAQGLAGLYLLEVNTQPGMTPLSLVPEQARYRGMGYDQLVAYILAAAMA
jgi:D-alanine-D-alanine ligase